LPTEISRCNIAFSLDDIGNLLPSLLGPIGIKLNAKAKHVATVGDRLEGNAIANAGIKCRGGLVREQYESADPLGFGQRQRVEAESGFALKAQGGASFLWRICGAVVEA